jgi:hypothetical protein
MSQETDFFTPEDRVEEERHEYVAALAAQRGAAAPVPVESAG